MSASVGAQRVVAFGCVVWKYLMGGGGDGFVVVGHVEVQEAF